MKPQVVTIPVRFEFVEMDDTRTRFIDALATYYGAPIAECEANYDALCTAAGAVIRPQEDPTPP